MWRGQRRKEYLRIILSKNVYSVIEINKLIAQHSTTKKNATGNKVKKGHNHSYPMFATQDTK